MSRSNGPTFLGKLALLGFVIALIYYGFKIVRLNEGAAETVWMVGIENHGNQELGSDPQLRSKRGIIDFYRGWPDSMFPAGLGTSGDNQRSVVNIRFKEGCPRGCRLLVGWTPGGSMETEQFRVSFNGRPIGESRKVQGKLPYAYDTDEFQVPKTSAGEHMITLTHVMGDGLALDHVTLQHRPRRSTGFYAYPLVVVIVIVLFRSFFKSPRRNS